VPIFFLVMVQSIFYFIPPLRFYLGFRRDLEVNRQ
jgi:hypothetical protein